MAHLLSVLSKIFYWPGDFIVEKSSARTRRAVAAWLFLFFGGMFIVFPNAVWLVGLMSIVAILALVTGETPVEKEKE
jgi:hypothetical protein